MDSSRPRKSGFFSVNKRANREYTTEIILSGFLRVFFFKSFHFNGFHRKKLKIIRYDFLTGARKKI